NFVSAQESSSSPTATVTAQSTASPETEIMTTAVQTPILSEQRKVERVKRANEVKERAKAMVTELKEAQKTKRLDMQEKISALKDTRKKTQAQKLTTQIAHVNDVLSKRQLTFISSLENILDSIEDRTDKTEYAGGNVSTVRAQLVVTRAALEAVKEKVLTQQEKEYVVDITTEDALGQAYRVTVHQLRDDHRALRTELKSVAQKVRATYTLLKEVSQPLGVSASPSAGL
ncbi:MAG TPA: hypothetical protein VGE59_01275, partial [Patescibacteria group bacterium]